MVDPVSPPKPKYRTGVDSCRLKSGDHVVSSERWEIMIDPAGLYVGRVEEQNDKTLANYGCTLIYWGDRQRPEAFNPFYTWYVDNRCRDCDQPVALDSEHDCPKKNKEKAHGEGQDTKEG